MLLETATDSPRELFECARCGLQKEVCSHRWTEHDEAKSEVCEHVSRCTACGEVRRVFAHHWVYGSVLKHHCTVCGVTEQHDSESSIVPDRCNRCGGEFQSGGGG